MDVPTDSRPTDGPPPDRALDADPGLKYSTPPCFWL
jgi:hypothetical protein